MPRLSGAVSMRIETYILIHNINIGTEYPAAPTRRSDSGMRVWVALVWRLGMPRGHPKLNNHIPEISSRLLEKYGSRIQGQPWRAIYILRPRRWCWKWWNSIHIWGRKLTQLSSMYAPGGEHAVPWERGRGELSVRWDTGGWLPPKWVLDENTHKVSARSFYSAPRRIL